MSSLAPKTRAPPAPSAEGAAPPASVSASGPSRARWGSVRAPADYFVPASPERATEILRVSTGQPLDAAKRRYFEPMLGISLAETRVHAGPAAAAAARSIGARAYTLGADVVLGDSPDPDRTLAHELVHVAQQGGRRHPGGTAPFAAPDGPSEREAARVASSLRSPGAAPIRVTPSPPAIAREIICDESGCYDDERQMSVDPGEVYGMSLPPPNASRPPPDSSLAPPNSSPATPRPTVTSSPAAAVSAPAPDESLMCSGETCEAAEGPTCGGTSDACPACESGGKCAGTMSPDVRDFLNTNATSSFVPTAGFLASVGYSPSAPLMTPNSPPPWLLDGEGLGGQGSQLAGEEMLAEEGLAATEGTLAADGTVLTGEALATDTALAEGTALAVEGGGLAESMTAAAGTLTAIEAGGGAEAEAATGPVGWIVGGVVVLTIGGLLVGAWLLSDGPQAATEDASDTTPMPVPVPVPIPVPASRRWPDQTCENDRLDELQRAMHAICDRIPGDSCSSSKVNPKKLAKRPCSAILARLAAFEACRRARQAIQDECFTGSLDQRHADVFRDIDAGIAACETLRAKNCAPGHPMANL